MAILPIFIPHAGCPHQCVFCNQKKISGQKSAAVEGAKQQITRWLQWLKPSSENEAAFYGGSFTGLEQSLQKQLLELTDQLIQDKVIGSVRLSTRPDYIDEAELCLLSRHQVKLIELGVQSMDNDVLAAAERGHTAEAVQQAAKLIKKHGFKLGVQLMVGMPGQSFASVQKTAQQIAELKPDICRIYPLLVIKDTPLEISYRQGRFIPLTLEEAVRQSAYLYKIMTENNIKVIRVGLQPDDELCSAGNIVAGPFHPSMGELVQSYLLQKSIAAEIMKLQHAEQIVIFTPATMESKVRGLKNSNMHYWQQCFPDKQIKIKKHMQENIKVSEVDHEYL